MSSLHENEIADRVFLTYLKLSGLKVGYLLNFGGALMKDGITNGRLTPCSPCRRERK